MKKFLLIIGVVAATVIATAITGIYWAWVVVVIIAIALAIAAVRG